MTDFNIAQIRAEIGPYAAALAEKVQLRVWRREFHASIEHALFFGRR